jgi:hypothetical protein
MSSTTANAENIGDKVLDEILKVAIDASQKAGDACW